MHVARSSFQSVSYEWDDERPLTLVCGLSCSTPDGPLSLLAADPLVFFVSKRKAESVQERGGGGLA